jgi:2-polyprenyl-6-methoxyphenol hydroxylase-like FAD-dependent oxidoreductase
LTTTRAYDAVIIGGGIGGLALGCALAGNRRSVLILEARPSIIPSKRGLTLQANGLQALQKIDVLDQVRGIGVATNRLAWYDVNGDLLADLDYSVLEHPLNYLLTVIPSELEGLLREEFANRGGEFEESSYFQDLSPQHDRVVVRARRDQSTFHYSARILIGADGENSRVRQALSLQTRIQVCPDHFLFMLAGPLQSLSEKARQYVGRGKMAGFFPVRTGTYIFLYLPKKTIDRLKAQGIDSIIDEIASIMPEIRQSLHNLKSWDDIVYIAPKRVQVQRWVTDRVALLGDAVHALDPSWAQGANMTLQDTTVLASTLEGCFESGDFTTNRLCQYENARKKQTELIQRQSDRTARLTTTQNRFNHWLGKRILRKTGRDRDLMRIALTASSGLTDHMSIWEQLRFII